MLSWCSGSSSSSKDEILPQLVSLPASCPPTPSSPSAPLSHPPTLPPYTRAPRAVAATLSCIPRRTRTTGSWSTTAGLSASHSLHSPSSSFSHPPFSPSLHTPHAASQQLYSVPQGGQGRPEAGLLLPVPAMRPRGGCPGPVRLPQPSHQDPHVRTVRVCLCFIHECLPVSTRCVSLSLFLFLRLLLRMLCLPPPSFSQPPHPTLTLALPFLPPSLPPQQREPRPRPLRRGQRSYPPALYR